MDLALPGRAIGAGQSPGLGPLLDYATRTKTPVMAESVDTTAAREMAAELGATYARGRSFGLPAPLPPV